MMPDYTGGNLNLKKPLLDDDIHTSIPDIAENMQKIDNEVTAVQNNKVDKVEGKGLSTNDFSDSLQAKLTNVEEGANNYIHPSTHSLDMITETDAKKIMTAQERSKLSSIEAEANKYNHPSNHPATMITQDSTHRFVTDSEKSNWNAKETPEGAQAKADSAETRAKSYADSIKPTKVSQLANDANYATQDDLGNTGYGDMMKGVYDTNNNGKVDIAENSEKLGGQPSSYYAKSADFNGHLNDGAQHAKTARFVIGTSTAGWTAKDCNYLCDGTADQVEINNAITALPSTGGEIIILDGTYNITNKISVNKSNVSIKGNGNATTLKRMYNGVGDDGLITITASNSSIFKLYFDGNKDNYSTYTGHNAISLLGGTKHIITKNIFVNCDKAGVLVRTSQVIILSNVSMNNTQGVMVYYGNEVTVNSNKIFSCVIGVCGGYSNKLLVTSNFIKDCNLGISLYGGTTASLVLGNICIRGAGTPSDYTSSQYTIEISGDNNLISSNLCLGKAVVINSGTSNTEVNNKYE